MLKYQCMALNEALSTDNLFPSLGKTLKISRTLVRNSTFFFINMVKGIY